MLNLRHLVAVPRLPPHHLPQSGSKGKTLKEAAEIKNTDIVEELCLPPVKIHCSVLAEEAIKAAIEDLEE